MWVSQTPFLPCAASVDDGNGHGVRSRTKMPVSAPPPARVFHKRISLGSSRVNSPLGGGKPLDRAQL